MQRKGGLEGKGNQEVGKTLEIAQPALQEGEAGVICWLFGNCCAARSFSSSSSSSSSPPPSSRKRMMPPTLMPNVLRVLSPNLHVEILLLRLSVWGSRKEKTCSTIFACQQLEKSHSTVFSLDKWASWDKWEKILPAPDHSRLSGSDCAQVASLQYSRTCSSGNGREQVIFFHAHPKTSTCPN